MAFALTCMRALAPSPGDSTVPNACMSAKGLRMCRAMGLLAAVAMGRVALPYVYKVLHGVLPMSLFTLLTIVWEQHRL